jgi:hypothetical protein
MRWNDSCFILSIFDLFNGLINQDDVSSIGWWLTLNSINVERWCPIDGLR